MTWQSPDDVLRFDDRHVRCRPKLLLKEEDAASICCCEYFCMTDAREFVDGTASADVLIQFRMSHSRLYEYCTWMQGHGPPVVLYYNTLFRDEAYLQPSYHLLLGFIPCVQDSFSQPSQGLVHLLGF